MWWKLAIPVLAIIVLLFKFHPGNCHCGPAVGRATSTERRLHAVRHQGRVSAPSSARASCSPTSASSRPTSSRARSRTRSGTCPRAIIIAVLIGTAIYILVPDRLHRRDGPGPADSNGFPGLISAAGNLRPSVPITSGRDRRPGRARLAGDSSCGVDAFVSPFGTGLIYQTSTSRVSYGLARNRYFPQIFQRTDRRGRAVGSLILAFVAGLRLPAAVPELAALVGLITGASVLMYAGAPLVPDRVPQAVPDAPRPYRLPPRRSDLPARRSSSPACIIYWSGFRCIWKLGICIVIGYVIIGDLHGLRPASGRGWARTEVVAAAWLPVYMIGMGIISWHGQFTGGRCDAAPHQHRPHPVLGGHAHRRGVSLRHLLLGATSRLLPREEMELIIAEQAGVAADVAAVGTAE